MASKSKLSVGRGIGLITDFFTQLTKEVERLKRDPETVLERLREPGIITAIASMIVATAQVALKCSDRTVSITMDLSKTMTQLIANGRYGSVIPAIANHFSVPSGEGDRTIVVHLLHYNEQMISDFVLADMGSQGLRPATFLELLWIGIQHPLLQREFPIIALGTVAWVGHDRSVVCLGPSVRLRALYLSPYDGGWAESCRFAAVSK